MAIEAKYRLSRCFASLNMAGLFTSQVLREKSAHSREKFGPMGTRVAMQLLAAGAQDYLAVPDFSTRDTILVGILDHVTSQRFSDSG